MILTSMYVDRRNQTGSKLISSNQCACDIGLHTLKPTLYNYHNVKSIEVRINMPVFKQL